MERVSRMNAVARRRYNEVAQLEYEEAVCLDPACLVTLYRDLGPLGAENVVCRAMAEITHRLDALAEPHHHGRWVDLARQARGLSAIAEQVGMTSLSDVARSVADCATRQDGAALGACLARLERIGHGSLAAIWDMTGTEA